jgi:hypothetical protein
MLSSLVDTALDRKRLKIYFTGTAACLVSAPPPQMLHLSMIAPTPACNAIPNQVSQQCVCLAAA